METASSWTTIEQMECAICLSSMSSEKDTAITKTECGHKFHTKCLEEWIKRSNTCPLCRCESHKYIQYNINIVYNKTYEPLIWRL